MTCQALINFKMTHKDARAESLPVLHDRRVPPWNRSLLPEDFLAQTADDPDLKDLLASD